MVKIKKALRVDMGIVVCSLLIGLCAALVYGYVEARAYGLAQRSVADKVIRFHVLANSDSDADQAVKLLVRDAVIESLGGLLKESQSLEETRGILLDNMDSIEATAAAVLLENGFNYPVTASLAVSSFPLKAYGDAFFPAGAYEALRVVIGAGEGKNWWCVMFPPLCLADASQNVLSDAAKMDLRRALDEDDYKTLMKGGATPKFFLGELVTKLVSP